MRFAAAVMRAGLLTALVLPIAPARAGDSIEVKIDNFTFAPRRLVVKAGTNVTWINETTSRTRSPRARDCSSRKRSIRKRGFPSHSRPPAGSSISARFIRT
jgi:hypothetical protein